MVSPNERQSSRGTRSDCIEKSLLSNYITPVKPSYPTQSPPQYITMPSSTRKKHKDQIRERSALSARIAKYGIEMLPCSFCERNSKKCIVSGDGSARCSECARSGKKCDVEGIPVDDWESLEREERRIEREREAALERLLRLDKQMKFFKARGREMLRRGLTSLDELDEMDDASERERLQQQDCDEQRQSVADSLAPPTPDAVYDDNFLVSLSPSFWASMGASGDNPVALQQ